MAHISFDAESNKSKLLMTVYGNDAMNRKQIRFQLWQASTGKVYDLSVDRNVLFAHGFVYGCGDGQLLVMTTNGNERQTIQLQAGWNWTSTYLDLSTFNFQLATCMIANEAWKEGDQIKNPNTRQFTTYSDSVKAFVGTLSTFDYKQIYMISSQDGNTMHISGTNLPADSMKIKVRGDGQWSPMPCLLKQVTPVTEALSGYYDRATPGDMIKSHDHFAYFSEDKKWEGDLTAMRPGEGYLFRRLAPGTVEIPFYNRSASNNIKRRQTMSNGEAGLFTYPNAATNMTMIARLENSSLGAPDVRPEIRVFINDELVGVAEPIDSLYFITIQSDQVGELRFECNGERLAVRGERISYKADSHHGTIKAPVKLVPETGNPSTVTAPYKLIENNHVIIIRNNEKYDVTGKKTR